MAKKLVRRDKDTYNGAILLDSDFQAYGISYPRGTIVVVKNDVSNNTYTLLENVSASQTVANSLVQPGVVVVSDSPVIVNSIWAGTQIQYDALGTYDTNTLYNII